MSQREVPPTTNESKPRTISGLVSLACLLEVSAPKPGNVHRGADFEDVTFGDFVTSAVLLGESLQADLQRPLGEMVFQAVQRNRAAVGTNTNLGIVLLLAPLAKAIEKARGTRLTSKHISAVLDEVSVADGPRVFAAIRLAKPGGLGTADQLDVNQQGGPVLDATGRELSPVDLLQAMKLASHRDGIARQYAGGFAEIFEVGVPLVRLGNTHFNTIYEAIVFAHVAWMARAVDTLIERKCGVETALHAKMLAARALDCLPDLKSELDRDRGSSSVMRESAEFGSTGESELEQFWQAVGTLDFWLRSDGHRRNPGTTADLIAASLMVAIYNEEISIAGSSRG